MPRHQEGRFTMVVAQYCSSLISASIRLLSLACQNQPANIAYVIMTGRFLPLLNLLERSVRSSTLIKIGWHPCTDFIRWTLLNFFAHAYNFTFVATPGFGNWAENEGASNKVPTCNLRLLILFSYIIDSGVVDKIKHRFKKLQGMRAQMDVLFI
jgi:hypothetical protein